MHSLIALGVNGFIPSFGRQTMSFLLLDDSEEVFMLDAGTGVSRFLEPEIKSLLESKKRLNLILSHYHLDHIAGLPYLARLWSPRPLRIFAPAAPFVNTTPHEAINGFLNSPYFSLSLQDFPGETDLIALDQHEMKICNYDFSFIKLDHTGGSTGMRIEDTLCYITDTYVNPTYEDFITGADNLLHDVWITSREVNENPEQGSQGHSVKEEVINLAKRCNIGTVFPVHLNPQWSSFDLQSIFTDGLDFKLLDEGSIVKLT